MNSDKAMELIIDSLKESVDDATEDSKRIAIDQASSDTRLFGGKGILDSMDVVILLTDIEDKLEEEYDITISLASDSMMSKTRSPFRSIKSLSEYITAGVSDG